MGCRSPFDFNEWRGSAFYDLDSTGSCTLREVLLANPPPALDGLTLTNLTSIRRNDDQSAVHFATFQDNAGDVIRGFAYDNPMGERTIFAREDDRVPGRAVPTRYLSARSFSNYQARDGFTYFIARAANNVDGVRDTVFSFSPTSGIRASVAENDTLSFGNTSGSVRDIDVSAHKINNNRSLLFSASIDGSQFAGVAAKLSWKWLASNMSFSRCSKSRP